jgi:predicted CoA-binding protein
MKEQVLVLGASTNPSRYAYKAVKNLLAHGHHVTAVGKIETDDFDVKITKKIPENVHFDTVTLYLNPMNQEAYLEEIVALKPRRIIFNPGTENKKLELLARENGIKVVINCTLVMLDAGIFE